MPLNPDLQRLSTEAEGALPIPERPSLLPIPVAVPSAPATIQRTLPGQGLPDVQQLLAEDIQKIQQAGNRTGLQWFLQGTRDPAAEARVRTILPLLSQYRQEQANLVTAQNQVLGFLKPLLLDFHAQSPEAQAASRPLVTKIIQRASDIGQLGLDTPTIEAGLASPDFAGLLDVYTGKNPFWNDQRKQQLAVELGRAKTGPEKRAAYESVLKDVKGDVLTNVTQQAPFIVAHIRDSLRLAPSAPITEGQIRTQFSQQYPALSENPLVSEAIDKVFSNSSLMESLGVTSGKTTQAVSQAQLEATNEPIQKARVAVAAATGLEVEKAKRQAPASGEELSKYVSIKDLLQSGTIVKPPPGVTQEALYADKNYRFATPIQQDRINALAPTRQSLDSFQKLGDQLITATSPKEALAQGLALYTGAITRSNPKARAFLDASLGFTSPLSRSLGGEKGVLTNEDRQVMRNAVMASFFDTKDSFAIKKALTNDLYNATHQAAVREITGTSGPNIRSELDVVLKKLDDETHATLARSLPPDSRAILNPDTREIRIMPKDAKLPKGWEVLQ